MKNNRKIVIKDIAKRAGVAISTVSFVINKSKPVKKDTKEKVLKAIKELNYTPSSYARGLRTKKTNTVGVIIPDISTPYFSHVTRGMEEASRKRGYTTILGCTFFKSKEEEQQIDSLINHFVDGIILLSGVDNKKLVEKIYNKNIPLVLTDRISNNPEIPSVLIDDFAAMENVVDYLYGLGHRKIGYITIPFKNISVVKNRFLGYKSGLEKNRIHYEEKFVLIDNNVKPGNLFITEEGFNEILSREDLPTVYIVFSDTNALLLIKRLKMKGLRVPMDISIFGYGNLFFSELYDPTLTTIKTPKKKMGSISMDLLLDMIEGKSIKNSRIILPTEIIERESVISPNK